MTPSTSTSAASPISLQDRNALIRQVQAPVLRNKQLSAICTSLGLGSSGVKASLQARIIDFIQQAAEDHDMARLHQVQHSVHAAVASNGQDPRRRSVQAPSRPTIPPISTLHLSSAIKEPNGSPSLALSGFPRSHAMGHLPGRRPSSSHLDGLGPTFRSSAFYTPELRVGPPRECEAMSQHRYTVTTHISVGNTPELRKCVEDASYRVMVFCSAEPYGVDVDITFPHTSEIKVNSEEVKANLRGLKNRPGSTKPVDITKHLRLKHAYMNALEFTYALTHKKFYLSAYLCKTHSIADLVKDITTRRRIPKSSVIAELTKKAQDPDIVATSQVLSLKCPLSYMRLDVPCRSVSCTHIQCFDATSYLQLQEQGPTWTCPICSNSAPCDQLAVDEYVKDILEKTSQSCETVTIEPDGAWSTQTQSERLNGYAQGSTSYAEDDEDLEISEIKMVGNGSSSSPGNLTPSASTPSRSTPSTGPRGLGSTSAKRPAPEVIDLTFSSDEDEDDEPIRRHNKRQNTGINGFRPGGSSSETDFLSAPPHSYIL